MTHGLKDVEYTNFDLKYRAGWSSNSFWTVLNPDYWYMTYHMPIWRIWNKLPLRCIIFRWKYGHARMDTWYPISLKPKAKNLLTEDRCAF